MPKGQGYEVPIQRFRAEHHQWQAFDEACKRQGTDRSKTLRQLIAWYVREPGAKLPKRPEASDE